jgi:hypothetical protein
LERFQNNADLHKHDAIGQIFIGMLIKLTYHKINLFSSCMPGAPLAVGAGGGLARPVIRVLSYAIIFLLLFRAMIGADYIKQIETRSIIKRPRHLGYIQSANIEKKFCIL